MMKKISTSTIAVAIATIIVGCATRDVAVFDTQAKQLTYNGKPIEPLELIAVSQRHDYGRADLIVISTNKTETMDLRKTTEEFAFWLFLPLLAPDIEGTNKLETAPNNASDGIRHPADGAPKPSR
jgi:hypothetical protein